MPVQMRNFAVIMGFLSSFANAYQTEVVLAHYNEDLSWLTRIPSNVHVRIYTKGSNDLHMPSVSGHTVQQLPNVGRESHTYLKHIVENYERLADWTVFSQAGEPSFGYKGHRSGGGHLLAGDDFANYLEPQASGSRFVYTAVVHLPSMNHLLRASYCINDELLEGGDASMCPKNASQWTPWWDIGEFRSFVSTMVESQHGDNIMDFYRKYVNPEFTGDELMAFFPQGARFAVSKETIQRRPKADYEQLLSSLSDNEDPYAGYFMEWLWSELFLGHQEPCPVPAKDAAVSHVEAMNSLVQRFPMSVQRQFGTTRKLAGTSLSGTMIGSDCICTGLSGGVSGAVSGSISSGVSGGISSGISGGISGAISGGVSGSISGGISGAACTCAGVSGGISTGISGGVSGSVVSGGISGGVSEETTTTTAAVSSTIPSTTKDKDSDDSSSQSSSSAPSTSANSATTIATSTAAPETSTQSSTSEITPSTTNATFNMTNITDMANVSRVAGVFEVQLYVEANISQEVIQDMFTRALGAALGIPTDLVASLTVSEIKQFSSQRRLQDNVTENMTNLTSLEANQTKLYEIAYELLVPDYMDVDEIIERVNRIAEPGSAESQLFRQVLISTDGIVGVGKIVSKVPAYKVDETIEETPDSEEDEEDKSWVAAIVGAVCAVILCGCVGACCFQVYRRRASAKASTAAKKDVESGLGLVPEGVVVDIQQNVGHA